MMMAQKQAKVLRQPAVLQQSSKRLLDVEQVPVDGAVMETVDTAPTTRDILRDTFGFRNVNLPLPLDKADSYSYINNVKEPDPMPNAGWEG
jgi:hypothetical protein